MPNTPEPAPKNIPQQPLAPKSVSFDSAKEHDGGNKQKPDKTKSVGNNPTFNWYKVAAVLRKLSERDRKELRPESPSTVNHEFSRLKRMFSQNSTMLFDSSNIKERNRGIAVYKLLFSDTIVLLIDILCIETVEPESSNQIFWVLSFFLDMVGYWIERKMCPRILQGSAAEIVLQRLSVPNRKLNPKLLGDLIVWLNIGKSRNYEKFSICKETIEILEASIIQSFLTGKFKRDLVEEITKISIASSEKFSNSIVRADFFYFQMNTEEQQRWYVKYLLMIAMLNGVNDNDGEVYYSLFCICFYYCKQNLGDKALLISQLNKIRSIVNFVDPRYFDRLIYLVEKTKPDTQYENIVLEAPVIPPSSIAPMRLETSASLLDESSKKNYNFFKENFEQYIQEYKTQGRKGCKGKIEAETEKLIKLLINFLLTTKCRKEYREEIDNTLTWLIDTISLRYKLGIYFDDYKKVITRIFQELSMQPKTFNVAILGYLVSVLNSNKLINKDNIWYYDEIINKISNPIIDYFMKGKYPGLIINEIARGLNVDKHALLTYIDACVEFFKNLPDEKQQYHFVKYFLMTLLCKENSFEPSSESYKNQIYISLYNICLSYRLKYEKNTTTTLKLWTVHRRVRLFPALEDDSNRELVSMLERPNLSSNEPMKSVLPE